MEILFVLTNPAIPENVGFSLRAMNTMGFRSLRIVGDLDLEHRGLLKTAYGSHKLLREIRFFATLESALEDVDLAVGTTSKKRTTRNDLIPVDKLSGELLKKESSIRRVAIVFGNERDGLSTDEISLCQLVSKIPIAASYPSLNLAQSLLIYAWELSSVELTMHPGTGDGQFANMLLKVGELLNQLEIDKSPVLKQKIMDRVSLVSESDIGLLLTILNKINYRINRS